MSAMASQMTRVLIVYSTVCSCADQRKHQSSASLAFVKVNPRWPVISPNKGPVTRKMFPFDDVIMSKINRESGMEMLPDRYSRWRWNMDEQLHYIGLCEWKVLYHGISSSCFVYFFRTMESSPLTSTMVVTWCCMHIAVAELDPGDLSNHSLTSVPQDLDPTVIRKLILDNNFITTISVDSVSRYTELTTLRLRHNPLKRIEDGSFDNNRKLTTLAMKKCPLAYLPSSPELWMTQLTTFNLQNSISENNLHLLRYPYFSYFTAMKKLYLNNIPLNDSTINTLSLPPTMETFDATNMDSQDGPTLGNPGCLISKVWRPRGSLSWWSQTRISRTCRILSLCWYSLIVPYRVFPISHSRSIWKISVSETITWWQYQISLVFRT